MLLRFTVISLGRMHIMRAIDSEISNSALFRTHVVIAPSSAIDRTLARKSNSKLVVVPFCGTPM